MHNWLKCVCVFFILMISVQAKAQRKGKRDAASIDVFASPSLGMRVITNFKVPLGFASNSYLFRDSLNRADRPGQSLNFGINYTRLKNALQGVTLGLSYTTLGFRRVIDNVELGSDIHPKVGYVSGLVGSGNLRINHNFRYHYIEVVWLKYRSAEGYTRNLKEFDLWYMYGLSAAAMVRDRVFVETIGFTYDGKSHFSVKDDNIRGLIPNAFLNLGFRADYIMFAKTNAFVQPRLRIPLLPSTRGDQTIFIPQMGVDVGLVFKLGE
jgi:hypothetical protein